MKIKQRINEQIRSLEVRLIGHDGHQFGVQKIDRARQIAQEVGLDLVEVSPNAKPPVVKIIDYGKFKYEAQKKANESKKKQATFQLKEVQFRPNIEKHDIEVKMKRCEKFIKNGDKIKLIMQFRGREMSYKQNGFEKFNVILKEVEELGGVLEAPPKFVGNRILAMVSPPKKL